MPVSASNMAKNLKQFITKLNETVQEDKDAAIDAYCNEFESLVTSACQNITITIPVGAIIVQTTQGPATNIQPIVLNKAVT